MSKIGQGARRAALALRTLAGQIALRAPSASIVRLTKHETLKRVIKENISLSRFGDGELILCKKKKGLRFQEFHSALGERLLRALLEPEAGVLPAFNHHFCAHDQIEWLVAYERYPKTYDTFRTVAYANDVGMLTRHREQEAYIKFWQDIERSSHSAVYGDAAVFFLGTYVDEYVEGRIGEVIDDFRSLFAGRRILFVCPKEPLGGEGFEQQHEQMKRIGLRSAQFLAIPSTNAYSAAEWIETEILRSRGFDDVFIQAGPLASVLANELSGRIDGRVLDVGSLNTQIRYL